MEGFGGYLKALQRDITEEVKKEKERIRNANHSRINTPFSFEAFKKKISSTFSFI
ncbi:hypothetical protein HY750_02100 [Candidatus Kuenenbacteria bacterium]|nr:hypothetical protein [Candidatus Kuenenbacteria bacterium]